MKRAKITVVGSGNVGATVAQYASMRELGDIVITDIVEGIPQGKALDMMESSPVLGFDSNIVGTNEYDATADSDVIVITAGIARKPGMSRDDLMDTNVKVIRSVMKEIAPRSPNAKLVLVTNPSDVMAQVAFRESGFAPERIVGLGGVLDSARFRTFIAMELGVSVKDVTAFVLGGHGDDMVPLPRYSYVSGIPIETLLDQATIDKLVMRARQGGAEIVNFLKTGSAYYAPGASIVQMVESILKDQKRILPCSAYVTGQYGVTDLFLGVPVMLGKDGVEKIVEIELTTAERSALHKSADGVRSVLAKL
ncbi:malate dehydrogenase [Ferroacidibacillus organovorans]|uniref:Malate dehydrogenase n=1 Tax=Ferroacidibacillus organovorans TaxID=1765683 RepID=A0A853K802_9BACL|nr:malate dehydrogenase [Ferroacidibacillus organovorans]KYP80036.1 malate dehydrogenase [Ferroacidibacillus organovorans]OAG93053.1 malate dehydrogenase [Ferroacidibacillus organovorans]